MGRYLGEQHQKLQVRGDFSIIGIEEHNRLHKGIWVRWNSKRRLATGDHMQTWVRIKWWLVWYGDVKAQEWRHDDLGSYTGGEHWLYSAHKISTRYVSCKDSSPAIFNGVVNGFSTFCRLSGSCMSKSRGNSSLLPRQACYEIPGLNYK